MSKLGTLMTMAAMFGGLPGEGSDELRGIDILKEAELIRAKKSSLSARLRNRVLYREERMKRESLNHADKVDG